MAKHSLSEEGQADRIDKFLFESGAGDIRPTPAQVSAGLTWLKKHGFYTEKSQLTLTVLTADQISQARQKAIQRVTEFRAELTQGGAELPTESFVEANKDIKEKQSLIAQCLAPVFDGDSGNGSSGKDESSV